MPHLSFVEIAQGVAHGAGGVGGEVAFGRIEKPGRMGERLLGRQLDFGMRQAGDVGELTGDFGREGKTSFYILIYDGETLAGETLVKQEFGAEWGGE
jgi:hypothetical protein